jgi:hypothetical protein
MASRVAKIEKRELPKRLEDNQVAATDSWCRYEPLSCLTLVGTETLFIASAYVSTLLLLGGALPAAINVAKFMAVFVFLSFSARMISDALSDKITIAATSALGLKMVSLIAPKIVGW